MAGTSHYSVRCVTTTARKSSATSGKGWLSRTDQPLPGKHHGVASFPYAAPPAPVDAIPVQSGGWATTGRRYSCQPAQPTRSVSDVTRPTTPSLRPYDCRHQCAGQSRRSPSFTVGGVANAALPTSRRCRVAATQYTGGSVTSCQRRRRQQASSVTRPAQRSGRAPPARESCHEWVTSAGPAGAARRPRRTGMDE